MIEQTLESETLMRAPTTERPSTGRAISRYWYVVLVCVVLGAACGAVYAFKRPPVYTASARLSALNVNTALSAGTAGSLETAQELAGTYARVVQTSQVTQAVASALHTTPAWAFQHVTATPIPNSPFVRIDANASTPATAMTAANAALKALLPYVRQLTLLPSGAPLLATVRADALKLGRAQSQLGVLRGQAAATTTPSTGLQQRINAATANVAVAQTRLDGAQEAYTEQATTQASARQAIATSRALIATSDRKQVAQVAILLGLLVGLVIGVAAAMALAARRAR
jgi:Chain length determinant protein